MEIKYFLNAYYMAYQPYHPDHLAHLDHLDQLYNIGTLLVCAFVLIFTLLPICLCPYFTLGETITRAKGQKGKKAKG